ncbi:hypothetical protein HMPREF1436_01410 [Helicobacter pylori GAMchJs136i]|nr:hypothetical protein HMPREF1436_01410 [Helicobacter pylori GAMchJs136i]
MDAFQGEEADIIIYSTVKTCGNLSFLLDSKRLNVAISRAKENLIFMGKKSFFENLRSDKNNLALFCKSVDRQFISKDNHQTFRFKTLFQNAFTDLSKALFITNTIPFIM